MSNSNKEEARRSLLERFVHAQDSGGLYDGTGTYAEALEEVRAGHKRGHWSPSRASGTTRRDY